MKPQFELGKMTTLDDVMKLVKLELNNLFCLGEESGERYANDMLPRNPDKQIREASEKIKTKIDQFFLDNR